MSEQPNQSPPNNAPPNANKVLGNLESYLKLAVGLVGFVAAMGYPAVYGQYTRLNIPKLFISYDQILRAGVLPAVILAVVGLYLYGAVKELRAGKQVREGELSAYFIPIVLLAVLAFLALFLTWLAGFFASCLLFFRGIAWAISTTFDLRLTDGALLNVGGGLLALVLVVEILLFRLKPEFFLNLPNRLFRRRAEEPEHSSIASPIDTHWLAGDNLGDVRKFIFTWTLGAIVLFPTVTIGFLYAIKALLDLWHSDAAHWFQPGSILLAGALFALGMGLFGAVFLLQSYRESQDKAERAKSIWVLAMILGVLYLLWMGLYSTSLYPGIPQGIGGGQPAQAVFWLNNDDFADGLATHLEYANCREQNAIVTCEIYLIHIDDQIVIVVDNREPPSSGFLLPRENIIAVSW